MRRVFFGFAVLGALALFGCGGDKGAGGGKDELVILWAQWQPADALQKLVDTYPGGIRVRVEQVPWAQYLDKRNTVWAGKSSEYDIIIGDSQWLGQGAEEKHYVDLTDWMKTAVKMDDITPAALAAYGEYPAGSGKYYAMPCESDGIGFAYRKDLFEDPKEMAAFRAKYGYDLAPPKTWGQFRDIAEFFTRPDQKLYGCALFYSKQYDSVTMGFEQVLWCYGGDWVDKNENPMGVINSPDAVRALEFFIDLKKFAPPGVVNYYFEETKNAFNTGQLAMAEEWFAFMPGINDPKTNKFFDHTGYFLSPGGPKGHYVSLGGQGMSISSYSKKQGEARKFMEWFAKQETQLAWAKLGGYTANINVLKSDDFKNAAPYNAVFSETVPLLKDFANNKVYQQLLDVSQEKLNAAVTGQLTPKEALDAIAQSQLKTLTQAGLVTSK